MWILQISDLHMDSGETSLLGLPANVLQLMNKSISEQIEAGKSVVIVVCGDLTLKGDPTGYGLAQEFLTLLKEQLSRRYVVSLLVCPGNHDSNGNHAPHESYFSAFSREMRKLDPRPEVAFSRERSVCLCAEDDVDFVMVNSAYKGDHRVGNVNLEQLRTALKRADHSSKVCVLHHHLLPTIGDNRSSVAEAYDLLKLVASNGVTVVLHGHQHMHMGMSIGREGCSIIGVGSLFASDTPNINNQFNLVELTGGVMVRGWTYRLAGDLCDRGRRGRFVGSEIHL